MQRSGQAADREDIERQAESKGRQQTVRVYRQSRKTEYRGYAQNVSRGKTRLCNVCREVCCLYVGE